MAAQSSTAEVNQSVNQPNIGENATPTPSSAPIAPSSSSLPQNTEDTDKEERGVKRKEMSKKPPNQSKVWDHFDKLSLEETNGEIRAACKYCKQTYACDPNKHGTTSLKRHIPKCKKNPHKATTDKKQSMLNYVAPTGLVPHVYSQKKCRRALAEMIICDELPFNIVKKKGFQKFVHELEPRFQIPSRRTVSTDCWNLYLGEVEKLKKLLKKCAHRVCLTTDCWTSNQNYYYLCLTGHFIDSEWHLHKRILSFVQVENHKGETLGKTIEKCLLDWGHR